MLAAFYFTLNQVGSLKHLEVLGDGVHGNRKAPGDIGDTGGLLPQLAQDRSPRRVSHGGENSVERAGVIFNHVVEYKVSARVLSTLLLAQG